MTTATGQSAPGSRLVLVECDGAVATIRLNRPPVNALDGSLRAELAQAARAVSASQDVRAVVVTGGNRVFAAGADIGELAAASLADMTAAVADLQDDLGVRLEQALFLSVFASDDKRAGMSSFLEHGPGKAVFTGS